MKHFSIVRWRFQKCPLSVLEMRLSYTEYSYSKMTEKRQGLTSGVRLIEMSVKRELTERNKFYSNSILHYRDIK